jgi:tetratricopeptide (TPR) repeat protein
MFILIPLLLLVISATGILVIVYRKRSYLNKLYAINTAGDGVLEVSLTDSDFAWKSYWAELFPEVKTAWDKVGVNGYKSIWLMETEKTLRKMRLVFLRVDRWSDLLIKKIRRIHANNKLNERQTVSNEIPDIRLASAVPAVPFSDDDFVSPEPKISIEFLRNEEQRLIMEIAKNPKNPNLYESLGDLYVEMRNYIDAKESYEAAIELNSQSESLRQKLSLALKHAAHS